MCFAFFVRQPRRLGLVKSFVVTAAVSALARFQRAVAVMSSPGVTEGQLIFQKCIFPPLQALRPHHDV
jgi:hypothetical protein